MIQRLLIFLAAITVVERVGADCWRIYQNAQHADLPTLETLYQEAQTTPDCDDEFRTNLGRQVALGYLKQVENELRVNPQAEVFDLLQKSLDHARLWNALSMAGDVLYDRRDYYRATVHYQEALDVINDPRATPKAPDSDHIQAIFRKAEKSRLLADKYVPTSVDRSGAPAGLAATSIRGFIPRKRDIPITFEFDSVTFDAKGEEAAADMLDYLSRQGAPQITLIGHTDPRGTDAYNLGLSRKRAKAVKAYLLAHNYRGRISTEGRGEREPPRDLDNPKEYTSEEEFYRLHRRVELRKE